ncbi:MAG: ABC-three component system protein [bacterium]
MNRTNYFDYIEEKLSVLSNRINSRGKLNILDLHLHSENFYASFLNQLFKWSLENLNNVKQNVESIDLIDKTNKFLIQVSATNTKQKIESSLTKEFIKNYPDYIFKFVSISKDATNLRKCTFKNPNFISFNPDDDIIDNRSILNKILSLTIDMQVEIYEFIKKELGAEVDPIKLDSNLASIINILSKEDLTISTKSAGKGFEIEQKIRHNKLDITKPIIDEYKIYHSRLDKKYKEFDISGSNKSLSVLQCIHSTYIETLVKFDNKDSDSIFFIILDLIKEKVLKSANYVKIPVDELELCVKIIVVDAFIRCKLFENPEGYSYATTR